MPFSVFCWKKKNVEKLQLLGATWKKRQHLGVLIELGLEHLYPKATHAAMCGFSDTDRVSSIHWALVSWWNDKSPAVTRWGRPGTCGGSFSVRWSPWVSCQGGYLPSHDLSNTIAVARVFWDHWLTQAQQNQCDITQLAWKRFVVEEF